MCGRFVSTNSAERIASYFGASFDTPEQSATDAPTIAENFNVAPTNDVFAVVGAVGETSGADNEQASTSAVRVFRWGLVPSWAKDVKIASKMINARSETIAEKPAFKKLFASRRLIIPMDGFYEWRHSQPAVTRAKQPMFIHSVDRTPLAVAGLWTSWCDPAIPEGDGPRWLHTCTIITTAANETMASVHNRMPVLLSADHWTEWLDPADADVEALQRLLVPAPNTVLTMHPVSAAVNNVRNKGPELIEPCAALGAVTVVPLDRGQLFN